MFNAMLEVSPFPEQSDAYLGMARVLRPELDKIDGFIDNTRYASLTRDGWLLSLSSWRDEKALVRWRTTASHHKVQQAARDRVFSDYRLRIGETARDTRLPPGQALTTQRLDVTASGAGKAVILLDAKSSPGWLDGASADEVAISVGLNPKSPGLISWDVFRALQAPDEVIAVATWRDESAALAYEMSARVPNDVRQRTIRIVREYGMFDRREAPQYFDEVRREA
ncbi:antibiotic biosynthesis monooxygenase [Cupriavidus pauculus]|uniref:Antibiotic biosynthesis monooxygenase n=1 Tax=Cupriavidus pauculus TaxID=82633 RepID=A0A2N5CCR2_9BURK|nr:antibiotic biosynthesis monooxygenase [Cupriavidus pauculus]PLQ00019.1 antibiotic biosynthesis monooxygenase [Cupriavidus pauculus]